MKENTAPQLQAVPQSLSHSTRLVNSVTPGAQGWSSNAQCDSCVTSGGHDRSSPTPCDTNVTPGAQGSAPVTHLHDHPHCGQGCHQAVGVGRAHGDGDTARVQAAIEGCDELDACKDTTAALGDTGLGTAGQCCSSPGLRETLPKPRWATSSKGSTRKLRKFGIGKGEK